MNDSHPIDPGLQSLESRVLAMRPTLPAGEADELLYQCGFAAGRKAVAKWTRRWQIVSAALLLVAVSMVAVYALWDVANVEPTALQIADASRTPAGHGNSRPSGGEAAVPLDAWQVRADASVTLEKALTRFGRLDADSRSLSVGSMTPALLP